MAVARNLDEYRTIQDRRIAILQAGKRRGPVTTAKFMAYQLRTMAPRKSGRMISTIHRRENVVSIGGSNPINGFPYIHWVNATPGTGLEKVRIFGGPAIAYKDTKFTGIPGFFFIAQTRAREFALESAILANGRTLKVQF